MTILELKEELEKLIQMGSGPTEVMVPSGVNFVSMSVVGEMRVVRPVGFKYWNTSMLPSPFGFKYWNTSMLPSPETKIVLCLGTTLEVKYE